MPIECNEIWEKCSGKTLEIPNGNNGYTTINNVKTLFTNTGYILYAL